MEPLDSPGWELVGIGVEGTPMMVGGADVWHVEWRSLHDHVRLPHPQYPHQSHDLMLYEIDVPEGRVVIAAGEVSALVYAFYRRPAT